ncbi:hypothetical protein HFO56_02990 [Rhizobium laguerreae]|uniref:hypothetical protein n=1 Tax=Rhizobium laguerreae TaxID=1076926 RepID=UPI001C91B725|nr:hypothetical protein [Rhizobium laguerreae]MBY3151353.1 hypothetical protein [Rhizobium laguerreae]
MKAGQVMPFDDEVPDPRGGFFIVPDKRTLKGVRESLKVSRHGRPKWQKLRFLSEAQPGERGDIVMVYWAERPADGEIAFVKYKENLGSAAKVFIQPVFAVRLGNQSDDNLECWEELAVTIMDRIIELHGVVTASEGKALDVQMTGPGPLMESLRTLVSPGLTVLSGVPISVNGSVVNNIEEQFAKERAALGYTVNPPLSDLGRMFRWPLRDDTDLEVHRPKLRWAGADDWTWAFEDALYDSEDERRGDHKVAGGSDERLRELIVNADIGDRAGLALEKFIDVHRLAGMGMFGVWQGDSSLKLLLSLDLAAQFLEATDEHWHLGIEITPRHFRIDKKNDLSDAVFTIGEALRKQLVLHLTTLSQYCLEHTKSVTFDILCPFSCREKERDMEPILDAISEALDDADLHTDDCVTFDIRIVFAFDEDAMRKALEGDGRLPRSGPPHRHHEEPAWMDEYEAEERIAQRVSENLSIGTGKDRQDDFILPRYAH